MRATVVILVLAAAIAVPQARADSVMESAQQALKDQGFYYGEVTGKKDADTTAAIRRYQIRNGLKITGEINAETHKALGLKGSGPSATATPAPAGNAPHRDPSSLPNEERGFQPTARPRGQTFRQPLPPPTAAEPGYPRDARTYAGQTGGVFDDTPYAGASPDLQLRVLVGAQSMLARQGYYRSEIDGVFGPGMAFALRAYQVRFGLEPSGRLDRETLAVLGLLPGQRAPGLTAPRRPFSQRPSIFAPRGERVYTPR